jgi:hypothetical protein
MYKLKEHFVVEITDRNESREVQRTFESEFAALQFIQSIYDDHDHMVTCFDTDQEFRIIKKYSFEYR